MTTDTTSTSTDQQATSSGRGFQRSLQQLVLVCGLGVVALFGLSHYGHLHWSLDLLAHFQLQYFVAAVVGLVASLVVGGPFTRAVLFGAVFAIGLQVKPLFFAPSAEPAGDTPVRIVACNLLTSNTNHAAAIEWLRAQDADALVCQEVDVDWASALDAGLTDYRRIKTDTLRSDNFGIALYLRDGVNLIDIDVHLEPERLPWFDALLERAGTRFQLIGVHPVPPVHASAHIARNRSMQAVVDVAGARGVPAIVAGDLNATIWSDELQPFRKDGPLRPACLGFGPSGSWPSHLWFTGMILIDHVLVSPDIAVEDFRVGSDIGSDHRGIVADLVL